MKNKPKLTPELIRVLVEQDTVCRRISGSGGRTLVAFADEGLIADELVSQGVPVDSITCCDSRSDRCSLLQAKGYRALQDDFGSLPESDQFDFVLMDPPFKARAYEDHVAKGFRLLAPSGVLLAFAPSLRRSSPASLEAFYKKVATFGRWYPDMPSIGIKISLLQIEKPSDRQDACPFESYKGPLNHGQFVYLLGEIDQARIFNKYYEKRREGSPSPETAAMFLADLPEALSKMLLEVQKHFHVAASDVEDILKAIYAY